MGFLRVLFAMLGRDKTRAEGGPIGYTGDNRAPLSPRSLYNNENAKFPQFGVTPVDPHPSYSESEAWGSGGLVFEEENEKLGTGRVGHRSVENSVRSGGHARSSSYGFVDGKR